MWMVRGWNSKGPCPNCSQCHCDAAPRCLTRSVCERERKGVNAYAQTARPCLAGASGPAQCVVLGVTVS